MFDSRSLKSTNFYLQKFPAGGALLYHVTNPGGGASRIEYTVSAPDEHGDNKALRREKGEERPRQHNLRISREGRVLRAPQPEREVKAGDVVMWSATDRAVPGFAVRGRVGDFEFDSSALYSEAVFSNAFGVPGDYEWRDANGSGIGGVIHVVNPKIETSKDQRKWMEALKEGKMILISGKRVKPEEVEILVGQTVFWAVERADGITITDVRLLR